MTRPSGHSGGHDSYRRLPSLLFPLFRGESPGDVRREVERSVGLLVSHDVLKIVEIERDELHRALLRGAEGAGESPETDHHALERMIDQHSDGTRVNGGEHVNVQLAAHGLVLGALQVHRFSSGFQEGEIAALRDFAALASLALHGAHVRAELRHLAYIDPLTGLANRRRLFEEIEQRLAAADELALLFLDVDGLKSVNDRHGHIAGDLLIVSVANAFAGLMHEGELAARFGGDEFVALVAGGSPEELDRRSRVTEAAIAEIDLPAQIAERFRGASAEIVVAEPGDDADSLVVRGSKRMHARKDARKNGR